jgi:hypothetical protein
LCAIVGGSVIDQISPGLIVLTAMRDDADVLEGLSWSGHNNVRRTMDVR